MNALIKAPRTVFISIIRTHNFSARLIHLGMFLWAILRFKKPKVSYNHVQIVWGSRPLTYWTSGALSDGVKTMPWLKYKLKYKGKYFKHFDYGIQLKNSEWERARDYLRESEGTKYEFANFFYHAVKIFTGVWAGSRTTRQQYCLEHAIRFLNSTGRYNLDVFMNPYEFEKWADENLMKYDT